MSPNKYDKMYMDIALRAARESKCPRTHTGCCFLLESGVISIGFNGKEPGGPNEWDWTPDGDNEVIHAEEQCIRKLLAEGLSAKNATVYLTLSPCLSCAKLLTGAKVKRVVYLEAYRKTEGIDYLEKYGVEIEKYQHKEWYPEGYFAIDFVVHAHEDGRITNEGTTCCL